jgi:hypothetical protein
MRVLLFYTILVRNIFLLRRIQRDIIISIYTSSRKVSVFLSVTTILELSGQITEKY